jgi:hypothetical protein
VLLKIQQNVYRNKMKKIDHCFNRFASNSALLWSQVEARDKNNADKFQDYFI